ncbi:MAG: ABC transporter substrate-binding protein [Anaerolineae bacterium]|jgi:peptide/nickel transport system substrate-binding protein|nr:ABC transporter substrate-binding protein [Anaerolineae bacterium]MDH7475047.1 ABC transporter substrate-binding protein [Anaerolineae bacterium]
MQFKNTVVPMIAISVLLLSLTACPAQPAVIPTSTTPAAPTQGGKLIYGLTLVPSGIDPHVNASSELGIPLTSVYDTLVYQTTDGDFVPGLATEWEISDNGLVYTFHLRRDVTFHDGTPFNAEAVKFNLNRIADPETKSQKAVLMLGPYDHCDVVDEYTVKVFFREPYAPFLDSLSQVYLGMASPTAVQKWGADYQMHQVGTGPFMFKEYVPKDHLTLVRNPNYNWAPSIFTHQGPAYLDEIEFRFFADPATRALALESSEAHVIGEIPPQDAARLAKNPSFRIVPVPIPGQPLQAFLNTAKFPTDDLRVRQALLYATNRQAIVQTIFREYSPVAWGPLSAVTWGYDDSVVGMYDYDPDKARTLLDEAGWQDTNGDGIREKDGQPLAVMAYLMSWGYIPEVATMLQAQWREVGVDFRSEQVAYPAALEAARLGKHNLIMFNLAGSDPDLLRGFFRSDANFNWAKINDPQLDALLDEGARVRDSDKRQTIYADIQARIMDQALIIPIRDYVNLNGMSIAVQGLIYNPQGWFPWLYEVWLAGTGE